MMDKILNFRKKIIESYIEYAINFCYQHHQFLITVFRISLILEGLQEITLVEVDSQTSDTKVFYQKIKQSIITTHLFVDNSEQDLFILLILHSFFNLFIMCCLLLLHKQSKLNYCVYIIMAIQRNILLFPTLQAIFYAFGTDASRATIAVCNLIMYVQIFLTSYSWKQTILLDYHGLIQENNFSIELLYQLILILSVGLSKISQFGSFILLLLRYFIKLYLNLRTFNYNSSFLSDYYIVQIIFTMSVYLNISIIYVLLILMFSITIIHLIQQLRYQAALLSVKITFQQCQIYEILLHQKESSQLTIIQSKILSKGFQAQSLSASHLQSLLHKLLKSNVSKETKLIQIICNYNLQKAPQKSLIDFIKNFKTSTIYEQSYASIMIKQLNYLIKMNQQQKSVHLTPINNMEHKILILANQISDQALKFLDTSVLCKINLLENLRKGFQVSIEIHDLVDNYTDSIFRLREFINDNYDIKGLKLLECDGQDVLSLRILQMFYGIVLNDFKQSKQIEKQLDELLKSDKLFQDTTINNYILLQNKYLILQTSLTRSRGMLINCNQEQFKTFFNQQSEFMQNYQHIHELMPNCIAQLHDGLIERYLESGFSQIMKIQKLAFLQDPQNYMIPVNLHLFNPNQLNDFTLFSIITPQFQQLEYLLFDAEGRIQGITKKFFEFTKSESNFAKDLSIYDLISRGSSIIYYIPTIASALKELKESIENQQVSINNIKSYWQYPENHNECVNQTQSIITHSQKYLNMENSQILGHNVKILDFYYQQQFVNLIQRKKNGLPEGNPIEITHSLSPYIINDHLFFLIAIRDFKTADTTRTITGGSNLHMSQDMNSFSTKFTKFDHMMSEKQMTQELGIIDDIKQFCTFHHFQVIDKLFKEEDMSGRFVVDLSQKYQLNQSQQQQKIPFLTSRLSQRQALQTGMNSIRQSQPQFYLPQIKSKKQIDESQLDDIESEMKQLELMDSIRKQENNLYEQDIQINRYESNVNDDSMKISDKQNETQVKQLLKVQQQQGSQLQMIQEIVNFKGTLKIVKYTAFINIIVTIWIITMLFINNYLINKEINSHFKTLQDSIHFQTLQFYVGVPYSIFWTLYVHSLGILKLSSALEDNSKGKINFLYGYSQMQQLSFMESVCFHTEIFNNSFNNTNECEIYYIKFQSELIGPYKQLANNDTLDFNIFKNESIYRQEYFKGQTILVQLLQNYIDQNAQVTIKDIFIVLLAINFLFVTVVCFLQFQMANQKQRLKIRLLQVINRLEYDEIVELIARFSSFRTSWNQSNGWRLVNYYDLVNYDLLVKEKQTVKLKKYTQLNETQYKKKKHMKQITLITSSYFCWILFFILGFIFFFLLYQEFAPSFNIALSFSGLKQKLDYTLCMGLLIKTATLVGHNRTAAQQNAIISSFFEISGQLQGLLDDISVQLVASTYFNDQQKTTILDTLNSDLCPLYQYIFCYPDKLSTLPYFDSESYQAILAAGISGFVAQVYKYSVSEFVVEKNTFAYSTDLEALKLQIQQQTFKNLFIQYIQDIQFTMYTLYTHFNDGNLAAGNTLLSYINYYSFGLGLSLIIIYNIVDMLRIRSSTLDLIKLKYILLVLPEQKIENQIIKQKIAEIGRQFF